MQERQYGSIQFLTGPLEGQTVSITKPEIKLGRDPGQCDIVIDQGNVSRLHAKIMLTDAGWSIEKLASLNIVTVNQENLLTAHLVTGAIIGLGAVVSFRFSIAEYEQTQKLKRPDPPLQQHHVSPPAPRSLVPSTPSPENAVTLRYTPPDYVPDVVDLSDPPTLPAPSALPAHQLQTALNELRVQQEAAITQLHNEVHILNEQLHLEQAGRVQVERKIEVLERRVTNLGVDVFQLKPHKEAMPKLPAVETVAIGLVMIISTIFLLFLFSKVYFDHPALRQNHVATDIVGNILTVLGSVYLAYELLGRRDGILLWLTQFASCAIVSIIPFELVAFALTQIQIGNNGHLIDFYALKVVCIGIVLAGFGGIWIGIPVTSQRGYLAPKTIFGGIAAATVFWLVLIFTIITPEESFTLDKQGILSPNPPVIFLVITGVIILGIFSSFALVAIRSYYGDISSETVRRMREEHRHEEHIEEEIQHSTQKVFSRRGAIGGALIGTSTLIASSFILLLLGIFGISHQQYPFWLLIVLFVVAILCISISALAGSIVRYVYWFVNHVPERYIGMFGLTLALSGALLVFVHPFLDLLVAIIKG